MENCHLHRKLFANQDTTRGPTWPDAGVTKIGKHVPATALIHAFSPHLGVEEPSPNDEASGGSGAVVGDIQRVWILAGLQPPLKLLLHHLKTDISSLIHDQ